MRPLASQRIASEPAPSASLPPEPSGEREHLARLAAFFDRFAENEQRWRRRNRTYYRLLESICRFLVPEGAVGFRCVEERDAKLDRVIECGDRLFLVGGAVGLAHPHAAQADRGNL